MKRLTSAAWPSVASHRCFTLIEILVTIGIIIILMSMSMPMLSRGKKMAYRASCLSQLKQHAVTFAAYLDENDYFWPPHYVEAGDEVPGTPGGYWYFSPGKSGNWVGFVKPPPGLYKKGRLEYIEGTPATPGDPGQGGFGMINFYLCPGDDNPTLRDFTDMAGNDYYGVEISYAYNLLLYTANIPLRRLKRPNDLVIMFDADNLIQQQAADPDSTDYYYNVLASRHLTGANHLFSDFHAEWRPVIIPKNLVPE